MTMKHYILLISLGLSACETSTQVTRDNHPSTGDREKEEEDRTEQHIFPTYVPPTVPDTPKASPVPNKKGDCNGGLN